LKIAGVRGDFGSGNWAWWLVHYMLKIIEAATDNCGVKTTDAIIERMHKKLAG
jgi:hypothetical protein